MDENNSLNSVSEVDTSTSLSQENNSVSSRSSSTSSLSTNSNSIFAANTILNLSDSSIVQGPNYSFFKPSLTTSWVWKHFSCFDKKFFDKQCFVSPNN